MVVGLEYVKIMLPHRLGNSCGGNVVAPFNFFLHPFLLNNNSTGYSTNLEFNNDSPTTETTFHLAFFTTINYRPVNTLCYVGCKTFGNYS